MITKKQDCKHKHKIWVEFEWWYDGISMYACKDCWASFDRRSWQQIVDVLNGSNKYWQPTFLLKDGSYSWKSEIRKNPLHKGRTLNRIKYYDFRI